MMQSPAVPPEIVTPSMVKGLEFSSTMRGSVKTKQTRTTAQDVAGISRGDSNLLSRSSQTRHVANSSFAVPKQSSPTRSPQATVKGTKKYINKGWRDMYGDT